MTGPVGFNLTGFDNLNRALADIGEVLAKSAAQSANRKAAVSLQKQMINAAPVGPTPEGAIRRRKRKNGSFRQERHAKIRNSLKVKKARPQNGGEVRNIITVGKAYHTAFVEFGSIHNAANPFMRRTMEQGAAAALEVMKTELAKQIVKRGGTI